MRFHRLQEWLDWQETLHPKRIDLRLERLATVADALGLRLRPPPTVIVGGTNGKGTVATVVAALLQAMGFRVGLYTSPHLLRYNERVAVNGVPVSDDALCRAFAAADAARGPQTLTYFEFGTLAAVWLFREMEVDFQVLEVGLGGRLDAVNLWDADVGAISGVDLDHQEWLGSDREQIGREKAGIMRAGRPVVLGEEDPPASVLAAAEMLSAPVVRLGRDYRLKPATGGLHWCWADHCTPLELPPGMLPLFEGARGRNAATALAIVHLLGLQPRLSAGVLAQGLAAIPPARLQRVQGRPEWLLDVAHNPQSARELARWLAEYPVPGAVVAIVAVMADKDRGPMLEVLRDRIDAWVPIDLALARALPAAALAAELRERHGVEVLPARDVATAVRNATDRAGPDGRVVVFGSFMTVQAVIDAAELAPGTPPT